MTTRREFLTGLAGAAGAAALGRVRLPATHAARQEAIGPPAASGIDHVVVVMMENRSFDHVGLLR